jgi:hypothetical protein
MKEEYYTYIISWGTYDDYKEVWLRSKTSMTNKAFKELVDNTAKKLAIEKSKICGGETWGWLTMEDSVINKLCEECGFRKVPVRARVHYNYSDRFGEE